MLIQENCKKSVLEKHKQSGKRNNFVYNFDNKSVFSYSKSKENEEKKINYL